MTALKPQHESVSFLGLEFDLLDEAKVVATLHDLAEQEQFAYIVTPNADHLVRLHRQHDNQRLWGTYQTAALRLCDSRIIKALARMSGIALELVPGSDLTARLLRTSDELPSVAVVGGNERLMRELRAVCPAISWYHHEPPSGVLHDTEAQLAIVNFVEHCPAKVVFFAIGSPQSELICAQLAARQRARGVGLCIGASLEFVTGAKKRAPLWMQRAGLEWLFRLGSEPARLWRRYLVDGPQIFLIWWRWRISSAR